MICPKCGGEMKIDVLYKQNLKKHHSKIYWIFIGWWLNPILWILFTLPMLFIHLFKPNSYKVKNELKKVGICQKCGYQVYIK